MTSSPRQAGPAAVAGVGVTAQGKLPGRTSLSLAVEAFDLAVKDAGLEKNQIDGILTEPPTTSFGWALDYLDVAEALGINPRFTGSLMQGGASAGNLVQWAALAVAAGQANYVACVFGDAARTTTKRSSDQAHGGVEDNLGVWSAYGAASWSALSASRHMALYGTTSEDLGRVAVGAREWATHNPEAVMREPITLADHADARRIIDPFGVLDCCLVTDGGVCVIVTTPERARDLASTPVTIAGFGQDFTSQKMGRDDWWYGPHQRVAVERAYEMAGVGPADLDFAQLYDNFSISTLMWLEHSGICGVGEAGEYVRTVGLGTDARLPVNTHGGHLSGSHPEGWMTLAEGIRQMRGDAPGIQVPAPEVGLVTGRGMLLNCATAVVLTR